MAVSIVILIWLLLITLFTLLHLLVTKKAEKTHSLNFPSSPKKLPLIGNLHQLGTLPHRSLWLLSKKHGPLMHLQLGFRQALVVSSSHMAREVLKTHDLDFCTRPYLISPGRYTYNCSDISFSPYGEYWREMRKICILELFSAKRVETFRFIREEEVRLMIQSIESSSSLSNTINMRNVMVSLANTVVCRVALGKKYEGNLHRILEQVEENLGSFYFGDYFPGLGWIDKLRGQMAKLEKNAGELDAHYEEVINDHLGSKRMEDEHEDIVDVLLRLQKDEGRLTMENIKGVITDIFIAGTQTASATLVWAMAELAKNPRVMKKAQDELDIHVKQNQDIIQETDLHNLQYLKSIIKETLRLHAPVPLLLPRQAMRQCKIEDYDIMENTLIYINAWGIGRDPKIWEKEEEFIPERFLNSSVDFKGHDFEFIPFGSGRRICPAMSTGIIIIELALANLLHYYEWKLPEGMKREDIDMNDAPGINVHKKTPLELLAVKRNLNYDFT